MPSLPVFNEAFNRFLVFPGFEERLPSKIQHHIFRNFIVFTCKVFLISTLLCLPEWPLQYWRDSTYQFDDLKVTNTRPPFLFPARPFFSQRAPFFVSNAYTQKHTKRCITYPTLSNSSHGVY